MQIGATYRGTREVDIKTIAIITTGIIVLILLAAWVWYMRRNASDDDHMFDDMEGQDFEEYCVELLEAGGFENVEMTPASHDYGIDIIADKDGISYAVQCKCYSDPVGIKAIQEAFAGKAYYNAMVGAVMTNQYFTKPAKEFAEKLNIVMWDGDYVLGLIHEVALPEKKSVIDLFRNIIKKPGGESKEVPPEEPV